jgi:hypothetical protein
MQLFQNPMLFTAAAKVRFTKRKTAFDKAVLQHGLLKKFISGSAGPRDHGAEPSGHVEVCCYGVRK